jgi:hypothetical protein
LNNLAISLINAPSPRKTSSRARKMMRVKMRRRKRIFLKGCQTKRIYKRKCGKAYTLSDWLTDIESTSGSSSGEEDDEKVVDIVVDFSSPPPSPSSLHTYGLWVKVIGLYK